MPVTALNQLVQPDAANSARGEHPTWEIRRELVVDVSFVMHRWRDLCQRADHSFFLSPQWIECWLQTAAPHYLIDSIEMLRNGVLVGMALLGSRRAFRGGMLPVDIYSLNETGHPDIDNLTVEHNGVLADRLYCDEVNQRFMDHCLTGLPNVDQLALSGIPEGSALNRDIKSRQSTRGWHSLEATKVRQVFRVDLDEVRASGRDYLECLGSNTRSKIRKSIRAYEEVGGPLNLCEAQCHAEKMAFFQEMVVHHTKVWNERGEEGAFVHPWVMAFHERLIKSSEVCGNIQLLRVTAGNDLLGILYNFVWQGTVYSYQSGFIFPEHNRFLPGLVAHTLAVRHALKAGYSVYDFLAGDQRYKSQLSTASSRMCWYRWERNNLEMSLLRTLRDSRTQLVRWIREYRDRKGTPEKTEATDPPKHESAAQ